jgi:hypothetical protein
MISSLWKHSLKLWEFLKNESHKDETRSVAEYKEHASENKLCEAYQQKDLIIHPMNPLQEKIFDILTKYYKT